MTILAFIIGLLLPGLSGWLLLRLIEGRHPVLFPYERWTLGLVLGLTYAMFLVFCAQVFAGLPLTRIGFVAVIGMTLLILLGVFRWRRLPWAAPRIAPAPSEPLSGRAKIVWGILLGWIAVRIVMTGVTFLLLTPTFLDDSLSNWNLRGKVFYVTEKITLVMPNEDPALSPLGVSSYPPSLPLTKTWLSVLAGQWTDPLVNSIQIVWYLACLVLVYAALRRRCSLPWALLGVYVLGSLPLFLMHGTNAYADVFEAAHVFAAISLLSAGFFAHNDEDRWTFLKLASLATAILPFTKNEGLLVYLPPVLLIFLWMLLRRAQAGSIPRKSVWRMIALWAITIAVVTGPWLFFKWSHGLTFGNGKPFTSLAFGWQENVLRAMFINTFFEGNWLLLFPFFFVLLLWRWRRAFSTEAVLTAFFLIVYLGQAFLYLFTRLSLEALMQTGYARGLVQLAPVVVMLSVLLIYDAAPMFREKMKK